MDTPTRPPAAAAADFTNDTNLLCDPADQEAEDGDAHDALLVSLSVEAEVRCSDEHTSARQHQTQLLITVSLDDLTGWTIS